MPNAKVDMPRHARAHLKESTLTPKDIHTLGLYWATSDVVQKLLAAPMPPPCGGIVFPYWDKLGRIDKRVLRVRLLPDPRDGLVLGDTAKYLQPAGTVVVPYLPPLVPWSEIMATPATPLVITEGEKKAAAACRAGFACVGLGGVWSFGPKEATGMLPELEAFAWEGRVVTIAYDSDAAENKKIQQAERALVQRLAERGAEVRVARLPALEGRVKAGLDDWLAAYTAKDVRVILDGAEIRNAGSAELAPYRERFVLVETMASAFDRETQAFYTRSRFLDAFPSDTMQGLSPAGRPVTVKKSQAWWDDPGKQTATAPVLEPGGPLITKGGDLNMFRGWGVEPKSGGLGVWYELVKVVFSGNRDQIEWFERWLAYPIQHPGAKLHQCVFVYGGQGVGKTAIGLIMLDIYGKSGRLVQDAHLFGSFNSWIASTLFALGDDLCFDERRKSRSVLKSLVDGEKIEVNEKYVPSYLAPNRCNFYLTANSPGALPLDASGLNRRFLVIEAPYTRPKPAKWYTTTLDQWRKKGGAAAVHKRLSTLDLGDFHPNADAPHTAHKEFVAETSRSNCEAWAVDVRDHCHYNLTTAKELYVLYRHMTDDMRTALGTFTAALRNHVTPLGQQRVNGTTRLSLLAIRNENKWLKAHPQARAAWYEKERGKVSKVP